MTDNGSEEQLPDLTSLKLLEMTAKGVALAILILLTIVGNILVLVAVFVNSQLRSTTNYFIVNLAVADLLLGTTVLPFSASYEVLRRWSFGQIFCDVWAAVDVLCCTASIMSLGVISVDRYIGVTRPLGYAAIMTERRAILLILVVWVSSVFISIGPLFGWKEPPSTDEYVCNVTSQLGYVLFSVVGSFYIPTIVILLVYFRIYRAAVEQTKCLERGVKTTKAADSAGGGTAGGSEVTLRVHLGGSAANSRFHSCDNLASSVSPNHRSMQLLGPHGRLAKFKRQKKAAKTLGIVVGVFILCWFPFFFILPLRSLCSSCSISDEVFQVFFWLGYCNSCLNPIIYAKSSREFKRAFKRILRCRLGNSATMSTSARDSPPSWKPASVAKRSELKNTSKSKSCHLLSDDCKRKMSLDYSRKDNHVHNTCNLSLSDNSTEICCMTSEEYFQENNYDRPAVLNVK